MSFLVVIAVTLLLYSPWISLGVYRIIRYLKRQNEPLKKESWMKEPDRFVTRKELGEVVDEILQDINSFKEFVDLLSVATTGFRLDKVQLMEIIMEKRKH